MLNLILRLIRRKKVSTLTKAEEPEILCPNCGHLSSKHSDSGQHGHECSVHVTKESLDNNGFIRLRTSYCMCDLGQDEIRENLRRGITWENRDQRLGPVSDSPGSGVPPKPPSPPPTPTSMTRTVPHF